MRKLIVSSSSGFRIKFLPSDWGSGHYKGIKENAHDKVHSGVLRVFSFWYRMLGPKNYMREYCRACARWTTSSWPKATFAVMKRSATPGLQPCKTMVWEFLLKIQNKTQAQKVHAPLIWTQKPLSKKHASSVGILYWCWRHSVHRSPIELQFRF